MSTLFSFTEFPPTTEKVLEILEHVACVGISEIFLEWDELFPWTVVAAGRTGDRLEECEVDAIVRRAEELHLSLVPVFPLWKAREPLLGVKEFSHVRSEGTMRFDPRAPGALKIVLDLLEDIVTIFVNSSRLYIGGIDDSPGACRGELLDAFIVESGRRGWDVVVRSTGEPDPWGDDVGVRTWGIQAVTDRVSRGYHHPGTAVRDAAEIRSDRERVLQTEEDGWRSLRLAWSSAVRILSRECDVQTGILLLEESLDDLRHVIGKIRSICSGSRALEHVRPRWAKEFMTRTIGPLAEASAILGSRLLQAKCDP